MLSVFLTSYTLSGQFQSHVTAPDSSVFLLENVQDLNFGVNTGLYFKTGNGPYNYTGAIKTIGSSTSTARLSFFTFASSSPNGLKERLAIFDSGNIAIAGKISGVLDPVAAQDAATKAYVDGKVLTPGSTPGEMLYWNGTAWVSVASGNSGEILLFINGKPTWGIQGMEDGDVYNPVTGKIWMDRNLGASQVADSLTDYNSYGDLYQWGRGSDGHQTIIWTNSSNIGNILSDTTFTQSATDTPGHGDFIINLIKPFDWRSPQNDSLWQGVNGINNPCPSGYRLPTATEWDAESKSWSSNNAEGGFKSILKLPSAGYRLVDGMLNSVGVVGFYGSSSVSETYSRSLFFSSSGVGFAFDGRMRGVSVRCIKN